ncbi:MULTISPECIES: DUF3143 domain-containing protein [unclassified Leptolyngbya]|uniref:DUF3143 domain-containing protein n=1 Tax=unclassified Leptolyngbya TaxID=2650499 RepID=UPI001689A043|nr:MULTISPECIES: DUF3143 domain-containing protein [unclassified Leptolyngbya]MBD1910240.1 DUF3143 domain-containing protein [Leptolyngbya sp. FACHB-8]MBD2156437.1 DUF3143 domain-containing protein [Leptolyngbya sp. FACHB-16]
MALPPPETPIYNHPLPEVEHWLSIQGCQRDSEEPNRWHVQMPTWEAEIVMDTDAFLVRYINAGEDGRDIVRTFKYSLSRKDLDDVIFSGP